MNGNNNGKAPITRFTFSNLLDITEEKNLGYMNECLIISSEQGIRESHFPCYINAFIIGIGRQGEASVSFNLQEYRLKQGSMFLFGPRTTLQVNSTDDFKADIIAISTEQLQRLNINTKNMTPLFLRFADKPCLTLSAEECEELHDYIALIEREVRSPATRFSREVVGSLLSALVYKVGNTLEEFLAGQPQEEAVRSRAEEYCHQFALLLGKHYREERSVGFYARKLCITPKYLTTLIKRISGRSVSEWIDYYVVMEAKTLLKCSNMSIQEIAYYLNFPNQSFFGSYFKRNTGLSPSHYKAAE